MHSQIHTKTSSSWPYVHILRCPAMTTYGRYGQIKSWKKEFEQMASSKEYCSKEEQYSVNSTFITRVRHSVRANVDNSNSDQLNRLAANFLCFCCHWPCILYGTSIASRLTQSDYDINPFTRNGDTLRNWAAAALETTPRNETTVMEPKNTLAIINDRWTGAFVARDSVAPTFTSIYLGAIEYYIYTMSGQYTPYIDVSLVWLIILIYSNQHYM